MITYLINREDRPQRLAHAREQLQAQNLNAHVFKAIVGSPGWKGCRDSHVSLMERCRNEETFQILEDDVLFLGDYHSAVENAMWELPNEWDALFLGASPQEPFERYSEHLFKMGKAFTTHAIIWHTRYKGAVEFILSNKKDIHKIDVFFNDFIYSNFNCYCIYPLLCIQSGSFSSDTCKVSDVSTISKNYNLFCI
jgi:GR25 family glycosyltransferase involved in LPS biosynthesis